MDSREPEACLDFCHPQKDGSGWVAESCVLDVNVQLNFDVVKSYGSLARNRGDLVNHYVCGKEHG
jgi:hypothetical protein